ncbi:MAG: formylglycine-generating enzyme family protein [Anaerolineae bacterium]|nr:formylglycine-generating enzyme family protein [Anaerolineae bacterium]
MMTFPIAPIIPAPENPAQWDEWRQFLSTWRVGQRAELGYDDQLYTRSEFAWTRNCFSCCFVMMCDETFYDYRTGRYLLDSFLDHGLQDFGGYDAIVLWHAYPRIGFDSRNQFDFYREMPGGLQGLRQLVQDAHDREVKVYIAYNPWDTDTHREAESDIPMLVQFVQAMDADGIFLDTMNQGAPELRSALDAARPGVVLESENDLPLANVHDHHMSWAQWFRDGQAPGVLRNKWFEQRHMQHLIHRWDYDHSDELHTAWMNGVGILVWENVFGSWVGWNARDRAILRAMLPIQRQFASLFAEGSWTPLIPTWIDGVYASQWQNQDVTLYTLVNRTNQRTDGQFIQAAFEGTLYNLLTGLEVPSLSGQIEARGINAFAAVRHLDPTLQDFLSQQRQQTVLTEQDTHFPARPVRLKTVEPTPRVARDQVPADMTPVEGGPRTLEVTYRVRECGLYEGLSIPGVWGPKLHHPASLTRSMTLSPYAIDRMSVSNRQFQQFLHSTSYQPRSMENFLRHWVAGHPPAGQEDHPVVYIDLEDARAYAVWSGKRLPTEDEWQAALQDGLATADRPRVWNWTESEQSDGRTRFCILKGGSDYQANSSVWYADGGSQSPRFSAKFLLMWPGLDRCATIGFRCAVDLM